MTLTVGVGGGGKHPERLFVLAVALAVVGDVVVVVVVSLVFKLGGREVGLQKIGKKGGGKAFRAGGGRVKEKSGCCCCVFCFVFCLCMCLWNCE